MMQGIHGLNERNEPMAATAATKWMTTEELFAMPDDGMDRELIRGELREKPMTKRNRLHSYVMSNISQVLLNWLKTFPEPRGKVLSGEAGIRLERNPDTSVGIDVAYVSAEVWAQQAPANKWVDGPPVLAVEILSPSDTHEDIVDKIRDYLRTGVVLVWLVDPDLQTLMIYRGTQKPQLLNVGDTWKGDPDMPGFVLHVKDVFD